MSGGEELPVTGQQESRVEGLQCSPVPQLQGWGAGGGSVRAALSAAHGPLARRMDACPPGVGSFRLPPLRGSSSSLG